jgi:GDP-L-fucose synthase
MDKRAKIFVAGHRGLVGSAIVRRLVAEGYRRIVTRDRSELDLRDRTGVDRLFAAERPEYVVLAAAKVGGILANSTYPAEFIHDNLEIQTHVIDASYRAGVRKLLFLGSSCIYPKHAPQPLKEEYLLTGQLEPTNEAYAVAKISGLTMCRAYHRQFGFNAITAMPTNLYGPGDRFDAENSHVIPALMRRIHEAKHERRKSVVVWGTGRPRREFMHADDLADACLFLMERHDGPDPINVGVGTDVSIRQLAEMIADVVGFSGVVEYDATKPDGTPRKLLDVSRVSAMGWSARIDLHAGLQHTYGWYAAHAGAPRSE